MDNMRELLAGAMSLASWKTLALLLAVLNLKSLPLIWHVSDIIPRDGRWNWVFTTPEEQLSYALCVTRLTKFLVPSAVPLRGQFAFKTQRALVSQGQSYCGRSRQTDPPSLRAMYGHVPHTVAGD
jgi:hypothetical protein